MTLFPLYIVTDRAVAGGDPVEILMRVAASLPPGTVGVEIREKALPARELLALARRVVAALRPLGARVLVNDRLDVAIAAGADGVHLPASGLDPRAVRAVYPGLIGVSTHSRAELAGLDAGAADFATFGPVFDTPSKRGFGPPQGVDALRAAVAASRVPVMAIGGIMQGTAADLAGTGISGIAVIRAVLAARNPAAAARDLLDAAGLGTAVG